MRPGVFTTGAEFTVLLVTNGVARLPVASSNLLCEGELPKLPNAPTEAARLLKAYNDLTNTIDETVPFDTILTKSRHRLNKLRQPACKGFGPRTSDPQISNLGPRVRRPRSALS